MTPTSRKSKRSTGQTTDSKPLSPLAVAPTGVDALDLVLGGGLPRGGLIELDGTEGSGRSTFANTVLAAAQAREESCRLIDIGGERDRRHAEQLGVDMSKLDPIDGLRLCRSMRTLDSRPCFQLVGVLIDLVRSGKTDLLVLDSIVDIAPFDHGSSRSLVAHFCMELERTRTVCLILNDRQAPSVLDLQDSPRSARLVRELPLAAHLHIGLLHTKPLPGQGDGTKHVRAKVIDNRTEQSMLATLEITDGAITADRLPASHLLQLAVAHHVVEPAGHGFVFGRKQLGHDQASAETGLEHDPELAEHVRAEVLSVLHR